MPDLPDEAADVADEKTDDAGKPVQPEPEGGGTPPPCPDPNNPACDDD